MKLSDVDYELDPSCIAQYPLEERSSSKLLIFNRRSGQIQHKRFKDIVAYLRAGDVLVLNDTKVIPARLEGRKGTGGKVEVLLLQERQQGIWHALLNPSTRIKKGTQLFFDGVFSCTVNDDFVPGTNGVRNVVFNDADHFWDHVYRVGRMPLPPYIKRETSKNDDETYQTIFARNKGAVAAPTAGLHFTEKLLSAVQEKGVRVVYVTLHVNYGTFRPVKAEHLADHVMHEEYYEINGDTAQTINAARSEGHRIIACGTTSVRVLETVAKEDGMVCEQSGKTGIFIYPPYTFKSVDALITNFHLPRSTLLLLVAAFAGKEQIIRVYETAKKQQYRFYSYGDAMLIV